MRSYPAVDNLCCAAPSADTLYTLAWLDVFSEPWVLSIPDMGDRYYIIPMLDGFSEVIKVASPSATGSKPQTYAITGPGWLGKLPKGVIQVKSQTAIVWILGRIYSIGTPEDYDAVHALQDSFAVVPLSSYGKPYTPPPAAVDPNYDMKTSVREQVSSMDIYEYFNYLGLLKMALRLKQQKTTNGWLYFTEGVGNWGTDYVLRGMANLLGPGWNRAEDAVYPISQHDAEGHEYDGSKYKYVMHFEKGGLPSVDAFWSLTIYDENLFFVPNPIDRYNLSQRNTFITNEDGSVDFYIQTESPSKDKETYWLPAPKGRFNLVLRLYGPPKSPPTILDGSWTPPPVKARAVIYSISKYDPDKFYVSNKIGGYYKKT